MSTQIARVDSVQNLRTMLSDKMDDLKTVLPSQIDPQKFIAAASTAAVVNPKILDCDRSSLLTSLVKCAADGLVPDGREAAMVPYWDGKNKCFRAQYLPMVFGTIKLMKNSGDVVSVKPQCVYENEELIVYWDDGVEKFEHKYDPLNRKGEIKGAYVVVKMRDGAFEFEAMDINAIEKRRKASSNQRSFDKQSNGYVIAEKPVGIWRDWYPEMCQKTVIHAIAKRVVRSSEDMRKIAQLDEQEIKDITPKPTMTERLVAAQKEDTEAVDGEIEDAEASDGPELDENESFPMEEEFQEGARAFNAGEESTECPYVDNPKFSRWMNGFLGAQKAAS